MNNKNNFINKIIEADTIAILGHVRPDGDCIGSTLGLYNYIINNYNKSEVQVYLEEVPNKFKFLNGADNVVTEISDKQYDLAISLDSGDIDRLGAFAVIFNNAKYSICIDHHISNKGFGNEYFIDANACSTCEYLCDLLDFSMFNSKISECFYLGIVHDTGVFKHSNTKRKSMEIAGRLLELGARSNVIIDETFYKKTYNQNKLMAEAIINSELLFDGNVIVTCITKDIFSKYNATKSDTDGIVDQIRITEGVEVAVFIYESDDNKYKYSLRSNSKVNVSEIAKTFDGGGHIRAAGFELSGEYKEGLNKVLELINNQL